MGADDAAIKKRLKAVANRPENLRCCDCGDLKPTWATLLVPPPGAPTDAPTLGAMCCFHCSGAHRRLGVHICFVRSLTLDDWKEPEVLAMERGGNRIINHAFEAKIGDFTFVKLNPESDLEKRDTFVKAKYNEKMFLDATKYIAGDPTTGGGISSDASGKPPKRTESQLSALYRTQKLEEDLFSDSRRGFFQDTTVVNNGLDGGGDGDGGGPQLLDPRGFTPSTTHPTDDIFQSVDIDVLESRENLPTLDDDDDDDADAATKSFKPVNPMDRNEFEGDDDILSDYDVGIDFGKFKGGEEEKNNENVVSDDDSDVEFAILKGDEEEENSNNNGRSGGEGGTRRPRRRSKTDDRPRSKSSQPSGDRARSGRHTSSKSPVTTRDGGGGGTNRARRRSKSQGPKEGNGGKGRRRHQNSKSPIPSVSDHVPRSDRRTRRGHTKSPCPGHRGASRQESRQESSIGMVRRVSSHQDVASLNANKQLSASSHRRAGRQQEKEPSIGGVKRVSSHQDMASFNAMNRASRIDSGRPARRRSSASPDAALSLDSQSEHGTTRRRRSSIRSSSRESVTRKGDDAATVAGAKSLDGAVKRRSGRSTDLDTKSDHGPSVRRRRQGKSLFPTETAPKGEGGENTSSSAGAKGTKNETTVISRSRRPGKSKSTDDLSKSEHRATRRPSRSARSPRGNKATLSLSKTSHVPSQRSPTRKQSSTSKRASPRRNKLTRSYSASDTSSKSPTLVRTYKEPTALPFSPSLDDK